MGGRGWGEMRVWIAASKRSAPAGLVPHGREAAARPSMCYGGGGGGALNSLSLLEAGLW